MQTIDEICTNVGGIHLEPMDTSEEELLEEDDICYDVQDPERPPIDEWLKQYAPGKVFKAVGADQWIWVRSTPPIVSEDKDLPGLFRHWIILQRSGEPINISSITKLAKRHRVTSGKWMIFTDTSHKAEVNWNKIVKAIVENRIPCYVAKISQCDGTGKHVICVYNKDFTDETQVFELEHALRSIGIHTQMSYKPDVYTYLDIYKKNDWGIRPTIYRSEFVIPDQVSSISVLDKEPILNNETKNITH